MLQTRNWGKSDGDEWEGDAGQLGKQPGGALEEMKVLKVRSSRLEKEYSSFGKLWKEEIGAKDWVQMCAKESLDPGEVAAEGKEEQLRVKVHHGLDEVLRGGQLDPGDGGSRRLKEVKVEKLNKVKDKDWGRIGAIKTLDPIEGVGLRWNWKEVEWLCFEVKQELNEASEALRLVTAWCSTLCAFSDYG